MCFVVLGAALPVAQAAAVTSATPLPTATTAPACVGTIAVGEYVGVSSVLLCFRDGGGASW